MNLAEEIDVNHHFPCPEQIIEYEEKSNSRQGSMMSIIFRNQNNNDVRFTYDQRKILKVSKLKECLKDPLKIDPDDKLLLLFQGKPLQDSETLSTDDVILYMNIKKPTDDSNTTSTNTEDIQLTTESIERPNILNRGFNRFLQYGISTEELHMLRALFHLGVYHQYRIRGIDIDWSIDAVLNREEQWLQLQTRNRIQQRIQDSLISSVIHNDFYMRINEPNICLIQGMVCGFFLNILTIVVMLLVNFKPKFRLGLQIGMVLSLCLVFIPLLLKEKRKH